jgi:sporulation protein YlmC with PRC-barrel domain
MEGSDLNTAAPIYGPGPEEPTALRPVPDLAGAAVVDVQGRHAGYLYGSLADASSGLIRYLDLALEESDRHILVPLGHTRITASDGQATVELRAATREDLRGIPPYEPHQQKPDGAYQRAVLAAHGRLFHGERYYAHPAYDHDGLYAGDHPIIRAAERPEPTRPLYRLAEMPEYRVAGEEADIRGWPLVDKEGVNVGVIDDLLFDPAAGKVRYALVHPQFDSATRPIPIGFLQVKEAEGKVRTATLTRADIQAIPSYSPDHFSRTEEERILESIEARLDGERHFDRPDFFGR